MTRSAHVAMTGVLACVALGMAAAGEVPYPASLVETSPPSDTQEQGEVRVEVGPARPIAAPARRPDRAVVRAPGDPRVLGDFVSVNVAPEGDSPTALAFSGDGSIVVVAHRDSHNLVVFDAATRQVVRTIELSGSPNDVAVTADGSWAVTANLFEDSASIVDLASGVEQAVVPTGDQPGVVRVTLDGATAVVGNTVDSSLSVVDIASGVEVREIAGANFAQVLSAGAFAWDVGFSGFEIAPDNTTVILPDLYGDQISFFDIAAGSVSSIPSQPGPAAVALSPDGTTAIVSHDYPLSALTVVDVALQSITRHISVGGTATMVPPVAVNPAKTKAVVAVQNAVRVVDLVAGTSSGDISTGTASALATTADGLYCMVGNYQGSLVSYATESVVATLLNTTTPDALAVSPAGPRAAFAHILRKEHLEVMNVNGAAGYLEGVVPTGPMPEGDKARDVAVSGDGGTAVVINNHSHNATIIDLDHRSLAGVVAVGERPGGVAVSSDGSTAVVANLDSTFASVIDVATATATQVPISWRGSQVAISPDDAYAYVAVLASGDGVWRVNLATVSVEGAKLLTGNMGSIGMPFDRSSGMTLSHDGATLVSCGSFTDDVSVIDTAAWSVVATVPVGTFPVRAAFSVDDSLLFVTNTTDGTVSVMEVAGAASAVVDSIAVGTQPFEMAVHPAGSSLYVANYGGKSIAVVDLATNLVAATIPLPQTGGGGEPMGLAVSADGGLLYVACNGADIHLVDTATNQILDTVNTGMAPAMLVYADTTRRALVPSPLGGDGLVIASPWQELFSDGFESGDTSAWSFTSPG